jgi:hypothetical protein
MFSGQSLEEAAPLDLPEPMRRCREPSRSSSVRLTMTFQPRRLITVSAADGCKCLLASPVDERRIRTMLIMPVPITL